MKVVIEHVLFSIIDIWLKTWCDCHCKIYRTFIAKYIDYVWNIMLRFPCTQGRWFIYFMTSKTGHKGDNWHVWWLDKGFKFNTGFFLDIVQNNEVLQIIIINYSECESFSKSVQVSRVWHHAGCRDNQWGFSHSWGLLQPQRVNRTSISARRHRQRSS